jgi:ABC-type uncharacterized transport system auxiliary subunit
MLLLNGCVSFEDNATPPTQYRIQAMQQTSKNTNVLPYTITVKKPVVVSGLNTNRIALTLRDGRVLDYYSGAQWSARLDTVLEEFIVESLSRDFKVVLESSAANQDADYMITTRVLDYQAEYPTSSNSDLPQLKVALVATVIRLNDRSVVDQVRISDKRTAERNTLGDVTHVLESMLQDAFIQIKKSLRQSVAVDAQAAT